MGRQREMAVLVTLGLLVLSFENTQGQKFRQLSGTAGQAVTLSCGSSSDGCSWNKDGKALALEERSDQARFSVSLCDLTIEPLLTGDEGKYSCNNGQSRHHLNVLVEAGVPYIEEGRQSMVHDVQEGRQAELHCVSQGGGWMEDEINFHFPTSYCNKCHMFGFQQGSDRAKSVKCVGGEGEGQTKS